MELTEKEFKNYFNQQIEQRYRNDGQYYLDESNCICHDRREIKINLRLTPASKWIENPERLSDDLKSINGWLWQLYNHCGVVSPEIYACLDRLFVRLGYIGKFKSSMISCRYADELYLIHDNILRTINA